eukprot:m.215023 g.215023  ORF g.215023 m.215023 type:complete len:167 (+) comp17196_c0_seq76:499-999(+)
MVYELDPPEGSAHVFTFAVAPKWLLCHFAMLPSTSERSAGPAGMGEPTSRFDDVSAFCHMRPLTSTLYQCFSRYLGSCQSFASPLPSELASCPNQLTRYGCCGGSPFRCLGLFPSINVAGVPLEIETSQHGLLLVDTGMQPFFQLLSLANMRFTFESLLLEKNMLV